jgi:YggT family protein
MNIILSLIGFLLSLFSLLILARVLLSYFPGVDRYNPLVRMTYDLTEPVLEPIRRALPQSGMVDFSPLIVLLGIYVLRVLLGV